MKLHAAICLCFVATHPALAAEILTRDWVRISRPDGTTCAGQVVARNSSHLYLQLGEAGSCGPPGELLWLDKTKLTNTEKRSDTVAGKSRLLWHTNAADLATGANSAASNVNPVTTTVGMFSSGVKKGVRLRIVAEGNAKGCSASLKGLDKDSLLVAYSGGTGCPKKNTLALIDTGNVTQFQAKRVPFSHVMGTIGLVAGTFYISQLVGLAYALGLEEIGYSGLAAYLGIGFAPPIAVLIHRVRQGYAEMSLAPGALFVPALLP